MNVRVLFLGSQAGMTKGLRMKELNITGTIRGEIALNFFVQEFSHPQVVEYVTDPNF
jgi:hypothetical protein